MEGNTSTVWRGKKRPAPGTGTWHFASLTPILMIGLGLGKDSPKLSFHI